MYRVRIEQAQDQATKAHSFIFTFASVGTMTQAFNIRAKDDPRHDKVEHINLAITINSITKELISIHNEVHPNFREVAEAIIEEFTTDLIHSAITSDLYEFIGNVEIYMQDLPKHIVFGQCLFWADFEEINVHDENDDNHVITM